MALHFVRKTPVPHHQQLLEMYRHHTRLSGGRPGAGLRPAGLRAVAGTHITPSQHKRHLPVLVAHAHDATRTQCVRWGVLEGRFWIFIVGIKVSLSRSAYPSKTETGVLASVQGPPTPAQK